MTFVRWKKRLLLLAAALLLGALAFLAVTVRLSSFTDVPAQFTPSARELAGPDRGFYTIRAFSIKDIPQTFPEGKEPGVSPLEMIQINLRAFRFGAISEQGMQNLAALFDWLSQRESRYILRFLYDWKGESSDPDSLEIITGHMAQLGPLLQKHSDRIFLLQGLLVGKWGEMNGTAYTNAQSLQALASAFRGAAGEKTYLSVRTPEQWRRITGAAEPEQAADWRIGLFNDGMMGNLTDCGTYASGADREQELRFQERLCRYVPNGGEVILDNPLNDFENAVQTLGQMHVTYLNRDYDTAVLEKWAAHTVDDGSCFDGLDGLTYIDRHLGYRYRLDSAQIGYSRLKNRVQVTASVKNDGFAPVYSERSAVLLLKHGQTVIPLETRGDLRTLPGGSESDQTLRITGEISPLQLEDTEYEVYLQLLEPETRSPLLLANEQEPGENGYYLGRLEFSRAAWYDALAERFLKGKNERAGS